MGIFLLNNISNAQSYPPCITTHVSTDLSSSLSSGLYYLDSDVYVTSDITVTDAEIIMAANTTIYITDGATLTLNGVHIYGCDEMWQGIILNQNSAIICNAGSTHNNTLIEDADVAIALRPEYFSFGEKYYYDDAQAAGISVIVGVKNTIFNRNRIGIDFYRARFATSTSTLLTIPPNYYPVEIYNTIFTCRDIPFTIGSNVWANYETFKNTTLSSGTSYPNTPATNRSPYIDPATYSPTNSNAYLKYPHNGTPTKSEIVIYAEEVGHLNGMYKIGNENAGTGTNNVTLFDNHDYGIKMWETDLKIENCTFQNTPQANTNPTVGVSVGQWDEMNFWIDTRANTNKPHNAFFDCGTAIVADYYTHTHINDNDIRSSKTQKTINQIENGLEGIVVHINGFGMYEQAYNNTLRINNNEFVNIAYPVTLQYDDAYWTSVSNGLSYDIEINDNWIALYRQSGSMNDVLSGFLTEQAINVEVTFFNPSTTAYPPLRCNRNYIESARTGIRISGWDGKDVRVVENNILINYDSYIAYNDAKGILLEGNIPQQPYGNYVYKNVGIVNYNYPGYKQLSANTRFLDINNGLEYSVKCNHATAAKYNILFAGIMPDVQFYNNVMATDFVNGGSAGLTLNNAQIGQQGTSTNACGNNYGDDWEYTLPPFPSLKTLCINSDATQSPMFIYNTLGNFQNPENFSTAVGSPAVTYTFANSSLQWASNPTSETCGAVENRSSTPANNNVYASTDTSAAMINAVKLQEMANVAEGNINILGSDAALRLFVAQQQLYRFLSQPNNVAAQNPQLQQFVAAKDTSSFGTMNQIATALSKRDTALVQQLLNGWNKTNRVDSNYAKFFTWTLQRGLKQPVNLADVEELAKRCPQTDGNVVFLSQNLYNAITNQHRIFTTSCDLTGDKFPNNTANYIAKPAAKSTENNTVSIYPNPASNNVVVKGNDIAFIEVYTMNGTKVYSSQHYNYKGETNIVIPIKSWEQGMYILKVYDKQNKYNIHKIIKQ